MKRKSTAKTAKPGPDAHASVGQPARRDVYQTITDQIVRQLEAGVRPWHKPWSATHLAGRAALPLRHNGAPYRGINVIALWMEGLAKGFAAPRWMTFRQAVELGGGVRKGEKASLQEPMHPADQFDAFYALSSEYGMAAEDIAARFGVTPALVKQRLKLATVSPALIEAYRQDEMNLDQLTAFTVTDDHAKQEKVWAAADGQVCDRDDLVAALTEEEVSATDPLARFVGNQAYVAAGVCAQPQTGGTVLQTNP